MPTPAADEPEPESTRADAKPEKWLDEHGQILFRFAYLRVKDRARAEDLVQETLIKGIENFAKFRGEASVRTWLFAILRGEVSQYFRRLKRDAKHQAIEKSMDLEHLLHPEMDNRSFQTEIEREEFWDAVRACFADIPEHLLETFLHRLENPGEKIESICKHLGIKSSNFSVRLFRTRLMLRECLEKKWV